MVPTMLNRLFRPFSSMFNGMGVAQPIGTGIDVPSNSQKATIAAGCFWGVEHIYRKHFGEKGLLDARVGYVGGDTMHPSYRAVCEGTTGHAEALQILFDPEKVSYDTLIEFFFKMHDPTTANKQGPDIGTQYRSAIFTHSSEQEEKAKKIKDQVNKLWWNGKVVTEIIPAGQWWDAEEYHQLYLNKNPMGYECPSHYVRSFPDQ